LIELRISFWWKAPPVSIVSAISRFGIEAAKVHVGRPFHGAGVKVRRHLGVEDLGHGGDLLGLPDAADAARARVAGS
jgi:hypothetical protein